MKTTHMVGNLEFSFTDADVTNLDNHVPAGEYNPYDIHPWLLHDHGFTLCVVFASNLQDAIDEAVDENKLERYLLSESELADSMYHDDGCCIFLKDTEAKSQDETPRHNCDCDTPGVSYLGNAGEPHDIESLGFVELPNPSRSFAAEFEAWEGQRSGRELLLSIRANCASPPYTWAFAHSNSEVDAEILDASINICDEALHRFAAAPKVNEKKEQNHKIREGCFFCEELNGEHLLDCPDGGERDAQTNTVN